MDDYTNPREEFSKSQLTSNDSGYLGSPGPTSSEAMYGGLPASNKALFRTLSKSNSSHNVLQTAVEDTKSHSFLSAVINTPVICHYCGDYIWGGSGVGVQCEDCQKCFHSECLQLYRIVKQSGGRGGGDSGEVKSRDVKAIENCSFYSSATSHTKQANIKVKDWSPRLVSEWLCAVNLWDVGDVFLTSNITGDQLLTINEQKLENLGIYDPFQQQSILKCVDELRSTDHQPSDLSPATPRTYGCCTPSDHAFCRLTFSSLTRCDSCQKFLRGLFHQGLMCTSCGYISHQKCLSHGLPHCDPTSLPELRASQLSYLRHRISGKPLNISFDPSTSQAPPVLIALCSEIESRLGSTPGKICSELPAVFSAGVGSHSVSTEDLWSQLSSAASNPNVSQALTCCVREWTTPQICASIRRYLRELPEPLIPSCLYEDFLRCGKLQIDSDALLMMDKLISNGLPSHHASSVGYFGGHLAKICDICEKFANESSGQRGLVDAEKILSSFYGPVLLRPPWEDILKILDNYKIHTRVVSLLIELYGGRRHSRRKIPSTSESIMEHRSRSGSSSNPQGERILLRDQEWYWEGLTREEVVEKLWDCPDGSFLLRDASTKNGEYTLTVLYGQTPKLLRISQRNGKYGLTEPYSFRTVVDLIEYYREHSLAEYNNSLDVKLTYPISKFDKGDEEEDKDKLIQVLGEVSREYLVKARYFELHSSLHTQTADGIFYKKQAMDAFEEAIKFFREQTSVSKQRQSEAQNQGDSKIIKEMEDNFGYLKKKLNTLEESREQVAESLTKQNLYCRLVETEIISIKPQLAHLRKQRSRLVKRMEMMSFDVEKALRESPGIIDVWDDSLWYKYDASRQDAQYILKDRLEGTFLVRKSTKGELALSLTLTGGLVGHCIIYQGSVGFGFTRSTTYFPTARALILYYSCHSLEECNPQLRTCLKYPAFAMSASHSQPNGYGISS